MNAQLLLEEADRLFGSEPRPEHFTNFAHCCECAQHDETLRSSRPESISWAQLSPDWDPFCFINIAGFKYFFPALVRLVLDESEERYFIDQFLFHLEWDGPENSRYLAFNSAQREYVVRVLEFLLEHRSSDIESNLDAERLFRTLEVWRGESTA